MTWKTWKACSADQEAYITRNLVYFLFLWYISFRNIFRKREAFLFKIELSWKNLQNSFLSSKYETASTRALRSKLKTLARKLLWNRSHFGLSYEGTSVTFYHSSCQRSDELYCPFDQLGVAVAGTTNAAIKHEREGRCSSLPIFSFLLLYAINPITRTHGHFLYSLQFCSLEKTKMAASRKLTDLTEKWWTVNSLGCCLPK